MRFSHFLIALICSISGIPELTAEVPRISLITCHAGPEIYELCGHSGIHVQYPESGIDYVVNYGLFDFESPNFIYRFVKGETDYMVGAHSYQAFIDSYRRQGRKVEEQHLALAPDQAERLVIFLEENLKPENRVYRYNYVLDNCATRCIDIIEKAIGDTITFDPGSAEGTEGWSFRDEMRHYHRNYPWYQFGIDLALGSGIDHRITIREKSFAPEMMARLFAHAAITDSTGTLTPLVSGTDVIYNGAEYPAIKDPTPWYLSPASVCWVIFLIIAGISIRNIRNRHQGRMTDTVLFSLFGLAGCLIFFLVVVSEHYATSPNWLIVWLNPLCFCGAIFPWIRKNGNIPEYYHILNFVALFLLLALWRLTGQGFNWAFLPLILSDMMRSATYIYIKRTCSRIKNIA